MSLSQGRRKAITIAAAAIGLAVLAVLAAQVLANTQKALPDLVVRRLNMQPATLRPGDTLTIRDRVENRGDAGAGKFAVGYYLTRRPPAALMRIGRRKISSLKPGKSSYGSTDLRLPKSLPPASYTLMACADDRGKVDESDETNNCRPAKKLLHVMALDTVPPTSKASAPAFTRTTTIPIGYTADGTGSPLKRVELWARTPGSSSYTLVATDASPAPSGHHFSYLANHGDGGYAFYTRAYDAAGNVQAPPSSPNAVAVLDTQAPTTTDDVPTAWVNHAVAVTLTASDPGGSGVDKTYYTTGVSPPDPTASSSVYDPTAKPLLQNGEQIKYFSTDKAGNQEPVKTSPAAKVDTQAPTSSASAPSTINSDTIQVTYTASDPGGSGLARVELWVKGPQDAQYSLKLTDTSPGAGGGTFSYTAGEGDGAYSFYTIAYDRAGNAEAPPSPPPDATTSVDTTPPAVTITQPASNSTTDLLAFSGHAGTAATDVQSVTLKIYPGGSATGTPVQTPSTSISVGQWSAGAQPFDPGTYTAQVSQSDQAGNIGTATSTFTVPTTLLAAGDIAGPPGPPCPNGGTLGDGSATSPLIEARSGTVAALGDNEYEDTCAGETQTSLEDYMGWYDKTWGAFKSRTKPVPGNHEYPKSPSGSTDTAPGYFGYFDPSSTGAFGSSTTGYYSYDLGDWHIVALNSNSDCNSVSCASGSAQANWLTSDLAA
ncbi:MAG: hypothetical protein JOZ25_04205, partial [Actinobacteria bacterium]|nr:hypothetical protein [Actinomycetota bacterium]